MKTAISMPDVIFHQVDDRAAALGISRSQFFVHAAIRYLADLDADSITERIDAALDAASAVPDDSNAAAARAGRRRVLEIDDEW